MAVYCQNFFCDFLGNTKADRTLLNNSLGSEKSISALENFHFRSTSGRTSRQNFFPKFFIVAKGASLNFKGSPLGSF